jgi:hypothetical protein
MLPTLVTGPGAVCTAGPRLPVLKTRTGVYRLTAIAGPVNRTCQATTTAVAARTMVTTTWRIRRVSVVISMFDTIAASAAGVFDAGAQG